MNGQHLLLRHRLAFGSCLLDLKVSHSLKSIILQHKIHIISEGLNHICTLDNGGTILGCLTSMVVDESLHVLVERDVHITEVGWNIFRIQIRRQLGHYPRKNFEVLWIHMMVVVHTFIDHDFLFNAEVLSWSLRSVCDLTTAFVAKCIQLLHIILVLSLAHHDILDGIAVKVWPIFVIVGSVIRHCCHCHCEGHYREVFLVLQRSRVIGMRITHRYKLYSLLLKSIKLLDNAYNSS